MPARFFDLHVCESQLEPQTQRERVALALRLGFDGVGLVHQARATLVEQDRCPIKPTELGALLSAAQGVSEALEQSSARHGNAYTFQQLTRLNFPADDVGMAQAAVANTAITSSYHLLAVQPQSERAFALACSSLDVDIISLNLSRRLPYRFKPALVKAAVARGLQFEVCFAAALRESGARRQLFANAQALCRETRGRNIIVSSCARTAMELRGPYDTMNMATLFGFSQQQAQDAISRNVEAALQQAATRKAYKGVLTIQLATEGSEEEGKQQQQRQAAEEVQTGDGGGGSQSTGQPSGGQQGTAQQQQQQPPKTQKRKFGQTA